MNFFQSLTSAMDLSLKQDPTTLIFGMLFLSTDTNVLLHHCAIPCVYMISV